MRRFHVSSLLSVVLIAACSSEAGREPEKKTMQGNAQGFRSLPGKLANNGQYAPILEPVVPISLGFGVNLEDQAGISNRCVEGTVEKVPVQEGFLSLDASYSNSEVENILNGGGSASASGAFKAIGLGFSARGSFSKKLKERNSSLNYMVFAYNKHHSKIFSPTGRAEGAKDLTGKDWIASCGTGYVAAADYGSMIMVAFSLKLASRDDERSWSASGEANASFMSFAQLRADISANGSKRQHTASGTLSVSVYQVGGKPEELGKILKAGNSNGAGLIESFALCDVSKVASCLEGLRSIENYLAEVFPAQIADSENGGAAVIGHYPFKYPNNIGPNVNPAYTADVAKARTDLGKLHEEEMQELLLMKAKGRKDDEEVQKTVAAMNRNLSDLREISKSCFKTDEYEKCVAAYDRLRGACAETVVPDYIANGSSANGGNEPVNSGE